MLPDLVVLLGRLARDRRVPASAKVIALIGISYALSPLDLLPDLLLGPLGMVDDLLVVVAALSRILNQVHPDLVRSHWSGQGRPPDRNAARDGLRIRVGTNIANIYLRHPLLTAMTASVIAELLQGRLLLGGQMARPEVALGVVR